MDIRNYKISLEHPTINLIADTYLTSFVPENYCDMMSKRYGCDHYVNTPYYTVSLLSKNDPCKISRVGFDMPVLVKSPLYNGNTIAIVGERPLRGTNMNLEAPVMFSDTFGQNQKMYKDNPRSYDLLIDYYLNEGFDVYCTNLNKISIYNNDNKINLFSIKERDIHLLDRELNLVKACHVIYLGDSSEKRFWYAKIEKSCNIYPHLSGSANGKWKEILGDILCTDENKVKYITDPDHTNIIRYNYEERS